MTRVRAFLASSLDGFIAGEGDDLSWLPGPDTLGGDGGFAEFLSGVGCLLMGRRTWDVLAGMDVPWPYGERPVLVATHRPLAPTAPRVRALQGSLEVMISEARAAAGEKDVYVDGGQLVRQALEAGLLDEVTVTLVPVLLGRGVPLWTGLERRHALSLVRDRRLGGGVVQLTWKT